MCIRDRNEIGFINAHGTATLENDKYEGMLFSRMFPHTLFHSTKGYTGHTLGAAGAIEAVITIMTLENQMLASSVGFKTPDPDFQVNPVQQNMPLNEIYGLSNSVAFGGNNSALIFKREQEIV